MRKWVTARKNKQKPAKINIMVIINIIGYHVGEVVIHFSHIVKLCLLTKKQKRYERT